MGAGFETIWNGIRRDVRSGSTIRNWGEARGYTGGSFKIEDMDASSITVSGGRMRMPRRISKGEFEKVYAVLDAYRAGNYTRSRMGALSQNTTYILSILQTMAAQDR
jgi:hypothetical protein